MPKTARYLIFSAALLAFIAFAVFMEREDAGRAKTDIVVRQSCGYTFIDYAALRQYVEGQTAKTPRDSLSGRLFPLERHIAENPYVEKVVVYLQPSGDVKIELWEETPSFRILTDTGDYYVSRRNALLPVKASVGVEVPLVYGRFGKDAFPQIRTVLTRLEKDGFFSTQAVGLEVSSRIKKGETVYSYTVDVRTAPFRVVLGTAEDLELKLDNFHALYAYLHSAGRTDAYKVVNLEFGNYLTCQKK